ncbi:MAG: hypothetical protein QOF82_1538 [Frankiales bacterium]|jgi:hypothetical protein|nr:hypothetical protein [Frankiales bacterium]
MAQRVQVLLVCDVHDDDATPGTETISFSLDGTNYEIDVCDEHAVDLREAVAPYVGAGRRISGARSGGRRAAVAPSRAVARPAAGSDRQRAGDIRAWAKAQGLNVNERGRIPATIVEQYQAAH